ncbi:MAG: histidine phosphatase family protein [Phycisphaerae bacterium]|nr:histidine phosphatase family protein [Gemmatimonadaceae bacterium]
MPNNAPSKTNEIGPNATPTQASSTVWRSRITGPAAALMLLCYTPAALGAQQTTNDSAALGSRALIQRLQAGGLVLACRHAETDRSRPDVRPIDFADRSKQRNITERGRAQAEALGRDIKALGIPVGDVFTSPMYRTRESAEYAFGRVVITPNLWEGDNHGGQFSPLFYKEVLAGSNRVLMTHQGVLSTIPGFRQGSLAEGDCAALLPGTEPKVTILGLLKPADWQARVAELRPR